MRNKKVLAAGLVFCMSLQGLASCGQEEEAGAVRVQVGVACYDQNDVFISELLECMEEEMGLLEDDSFQAAVTVRDGGGSQKIQNDQVEELIDAGCDVLCVNLVDRADPSEIIDLARENEVPIIFFNREPVAEDMLQWEKLYYVGADAKQSGIMQGELAADAIKENPQIDRNKDGKIQYVVLEGEPGHQDAIIRTENAVETLREQGVELEKLSYGIANWNRAQAENRMLQMISQHQNQIELVLANNDAMVLGALDAYRKLNRTESALPVFFGIDGTKEGLEAIKEGKMAGTVYNDKEGQAKAIAGLAIEYLRDDMERAKSFKVESKRSDKAFPMTSIELSQYVGGELADAYPDTVVDVHNPELTVHIEVRDLAAYVHASPVPGAGGMPVGSNGVAVTLLSGGIDSPVSSYMIAKRGVRLIPIHFFSFPYTSQQAKDKVVELGRLLTEYCGRMSLEVVPFTHIQEEIRDKCPEEYFTLIMRRFMMRIAQRIAEYNGAKAIVTGENLGQVASQTMEAMASTQAVTTLPVLQPLIGLDKEEIVTLARKIGTFDTSILPYEDCCTVFTPRHPRTRPKVSDVEAAESALDVEALVEEALKGIERIELDHD